MSQSPAILNMPHSMKKKIITALIAVVIGHAGVLWAVSHMKPIELKPIEKKPLKVKFVTIVEDEPPPPPPSAKIEPIKPKVEPKPIEKKIEPIPVEKPKVISQKVQKVERIQQQTKTETPQQQVVQKTEPAVESKPEINVVNTTVSDKSVSSSKPTPKSVEIDATKIKWLRSPKMKVTPEDLGHQQRVVTVGFKVDVKGNISGVYLVKGSGITALDERALRSVQNAKIKPYLDENGVAIELPKVEIPLTYSLQSDP